MQSLYVLVVEDEVLVGLELTAELNETGMAVVGPANSVAKARALLEEQAIHAAVLDINLGRETSLPIADMLSDQHIPFLFLSAEKSGLPPRHRDRPFLRKPYRTAELMDVLASLLDGVRH